MIAPVGADSAVACVVRSNNALCQQFRGFYRAGLHTPGTCGEYVLNMSSESVTIIWVGRKLLNDLMSLLFSSFCVKFPALCLQGGVQIRHLHPRSGDHFDVVFVFKCFEIIWAGCGWLALVHLMFLLQSFMTEQNDLIRVHTCQRESVLQSLTEDRTSAC